VRADPNATVSILLTHSDLFLGPTAFSPPMGDVKVICKSAEGLRQFFT